MWHCSHIFVVNKYCKSHYKNNFNTKNKVFWNVTTMLYIYIYIYDGFAVKIGPILLLHDIFFKM